MSITIRVNPSFARVGKALQIGAGNGVKATKANIKKVAFNTERTSKKLTPVDTGRLRSSIGTSFKSTSDNFVARIGTDVNYATFVHFGTRRMRARPFLTEGLKFAIRGFNDKDVAKTIDKEFRKAFVRL